MWKSGSNISSKLYLDIYSLSNWLQLQKPGVTLEHTGDQFKILIDGKVALDHLKVYSEKTITSEDLKQYIKMNTYYQQDPVSRSVISLVSTYISYMERLDRSQTIWEIADLIMRAGHDIDVSIDVDKMTDAYGPKGRKIKVLPIKIANEEFVVFCCGEIPRITARIYRVAEMILKSNLDGRLKTNIIRVMGTQPY